MRKDYIPVDSSSGELDEPQFVEQYWTTQWRDREKPPDVSQVTRRDEYRLIKPYLDRLAGGSRLLDGGCGMGEWTIFLDGRGFSVVGLDISAHTIDRLKAWFPRHDFRQGDLRHTTFENGSFDAYFSWGTFEHFESGLGECVIEAHRLIKPGGWLFVSVPFQNRRLLARDARVLERWDEHFDPAAGYRQPQRFYQWRFTRPELTRELELRGFRVHSVTPIHQDTGIGRWLQWDVGLRDKQSLLYRAARRLAAAALPASYASHMILAIAERR